MRPHAAFKRNPDSNRSRGERTTNVSNESVQDLQAPREGSSEGVRDPAETGGRHRPITGPGRGHARESERWRARAILTTPRSYTRVVTNSKGIRNADVNPRQNAAFTPHLPPPSDVPAPPPRRPARRASGDRRSARPGASRPRPGANHRGGEQAGGAQREREGELPAPEGPLGARSSELGSRNARTPAQPKLDGGRVSCCPMLPDSPL